MKSGQGMHVFKSRIVGFLGQCIQIKNKFWPSQPVPICLEWGHCWLAIEDYLSFCLRYGIPFEVGERRFLSRWLKKDWVIFDIGAHHGFYSLLFSHYGGQVTAFEPSQRAQSRLREHLKINACANVRAENLGLGSFVQTQPIYVCDGMESGRSSFRPPLVSEKLRTEEASVRTLDGYILEKSIQRLDFIKIDTEGSEMAILRAAPRALEFLRPVIMCELADWVLENWNYRGKDILSYLQQFNYCFFSFQKNGKLRPFHNQGELNENILAVPSEKSDLVLSFVESQ
ncbi:MAG TPA: FkbM family methyltransferase [Candidatus Omnitrophota bacterium]|nr:FkbM family methyltransferase [Candidatus Omnitrophota bacterium]